MGSLIKPTFQVTIYHLIKVLYLHSSITSRQGFMKLFTSPAIRNYCLRDLNFELQSFEQTKA